jgi:type IV secretory pathway VirB2 component (pilin)
MRLTSYVGMFAAAAVVVAVVVLRRYILAAAAFKTIASFVVLVLSVLLSSPMLLWLFSISSLSSCSGHTSNFVGCGIH